MSVLDTIRRLVSASPAPADRLVVLERQRSELTKRLEDAQHEAEASATEAGAVAAEAILRGDDPPAAASRTMEKARLMVAGCNAALSAVAIAIDETRRELNAARLAEALASARAEAAADRELRIRGAALAAAADAIIRQRGGSLTLHESGVATDASQVRDALQADGSGLPRHLIPDRREELSRLGASPDEIETIMRSAWLDAAGIAESLSLAKRVIAGVMKGRPDVSLPVMPPPLDPDKAERETAVRRAAWFAAVAKGLPGVLTGWTPSLVTNTEAAYRDAHALLHEVQLLDITNAHAQTLLGMVQRADSVAPGQEIEPGMKELENRAGQRWSWAPDRLRVARLIGWAGEVP